MRNLKKILALVLALMMVMSIMVTASASFTDADTVEHAEAVNVLAAAGVLQGKPAADGTLYFDPTGTIDRASAAKLIAYLDLVDLIDLLEQTPTEFTDVPATHWASGFVAYCVDAGYAIGVGNGKFNPTGAINGYSLAKMILLSLGVQDDMAAEKEAPFSGVSYGIKVAVAINKYAPWLLEGLDDVSLKNTISREHAAQMVFNALVNSGKIAKFGVKEVGTTTDSFGRPSVNVWVNAATGAEVYAEPIGLVAKYTSVQTDKQVKEDLGIETLYNNVTANGRLVEYYLKSVAADGTKTYYAPVVVDYTVATIEIGKADEKTGDVTYTLNGNKYYDYADNTKKADTIVLHGDIADKAVVTYAIDNYKVAHVYPTTTKAGTLTAKNNAGTITIGAEKYTLSTAAGAATIDTYDFDIKDFSVQLDQYNFVVGLTPAVVPAPADPTVVTDYIYVLNYQAQAEVKGKDAVVDVFGNVVTPAVSGKDPMVIANVVTTAGEALTVKLALTPVKNDKGEVTGYTYNVPAKTELKDTAKTEVGNWLAYTVNENGEYTLYALTEGYARVADGLTMKKGVTNTVKVGDATKYITSATTVTGIFTNKDNKYVTDGFTGLSTADVALKGVDVLYVTNPKTNVVTEIYAFGAAVTTEAPVEPTPVAPTYAYAVELGDEVANGYLWTVYASGVKNTVVVSSGEFVKGAVYTVSAYAGEEEALKGTYVMAPVEMSKEAKVTLTDTTFFVAGSICNYGKDAVVYNATTGAVDTIEVGDTVIWNADCTLIYIVKEAEAK